jgi:hypothetical protein
MEMAAGLIVVIPVVLLIIDCATLYLGASMNDTICRDAARAASLGPPDSISPGEPKRRAEGVVRKANKTAGAIRLDPDVTVTEDIKQVPDAQYGGPVKGTVTVDTTVHVFPPFLLLAFLNATDKGIDFTTNQTYAYTWNRPSTATADPASKGNTDGTTF